MILKGSAANITSTASNFGRATRIRVSATNAGTVTVAAAVGTFNAQSAVDGTAITISNHGFVTGDEIVYSVGGGTAITELADGGKYFVTKVDGNTVNLSTLLEGTAISLTDGSDEDHTITATRTYAGTVVLASNQVVMIDKKPGDTIAASATMTGTAVGSQP